MILKARFAYAFFSDEEVLLILSAAKFTDLTDPKQVSSSSFEMKVVQQLTNHAVSQPK